MDMEIFHQARLWRKLIDTKYNCNYLGIIPSICRQSSSKALWFHISKFDEIMLSNMWRIIRNGNDTMFWLHLWNSNGKIHQLYPRFFLHLSLRNKQVSKRFGRKILKNGSPWKNCSRQLPFNPLPFDVGYLWSTNLPKKCIIFVWTILNIKDWILEINAKLDLPRWYWA